jgi:hypothetical protein
MEIKRGAPSFWCKSEDIDVKALVIDPIYIYVCVCVCVCVKINSIQTFKLLGEVLRCDLYYS